MTLLAIRGLTKNFGAVEILKGVDLEVNKGEVVAGNVGSPAYMSFTIIGDAVNIASRLMQPLADQLPQILTREIPKEKRRVHNRPERLTILDHPIEQLIGD